MTQKNKNQVKKRRYISPYNIGAFESYLSDMASQGLRLRKLRREHFIFDKGEPCKQEYRVEIEKGSLTGNKDEIYKERGWELVTRYRGVGIFRTDADSEYREVYETAEENAKALEKAISILHGSLFVMSICMVLMAVFIYAYLNIGGTPVLNLLSDGMLMFVEALFILVLAGLVVKEFLCLKGLRKNLNNGVTINHHERWEHLDHRNWFVVGVSALTIIFAVISIFYSVNNIYVTATEKDTESITVESELEIPTVRLNDIEQYENPELYSLDDEFEYDVFNSISEEKYFLLNEYEVREQFCINDETYKDEVYSPSLETTYYEVKVPFLTSGVVKDVIFEAKDYMDAEDAAVEELAADGLDKAYYVTYYDGEFGFTLVVQKGSIAASYDYYGKHTVDEVLEAITKAFK